VARMALGDGDSFTSFKPPGLGDRDSNFGIMPVLVFWTSKMSHCRALWVVDIHLSGGSQTGGWEVLLGVDNTLGSSRIPAWVCVGWSFAGSRSRLAACSKYGNIYGGKRGGRRQRGSIATRHRGGAGVAASRPSRRLLATASLRSSLRLRLFILIFNICLPACYLIYRATSLATIVTGGICYRRLIMTLAPSLLSAFSLRGLLCSYAAATGSIRGGRK